VIKKIITFLFLMFIYTIQVEAASLCTYSESNELNSKAANVKVFYEIVKEEVESEMFYLKKYFKITIANVTKDFYVEVENDNNNELYRYTHLNATDGIITFNWENLDDITNFTFKVYSSDNTSCPDERYKTLYLTTPRFNDFYNRMVCLENPDFYMCQEFVTFKEIEETDFITKFNDFDKVFYSSFTNIVKKFSVITNLRVDFIKNDNYKILKYI